MEPVIRQCSGHRLQRHDRRRRRCCTGGHILRRVTALELARFLQAPLDQAARRRVHIADMGVADERPQDELDLGPLVRVILELGMVEQRVEDAEVGVA